jgi:hypothetical protein
MGRRTRGAGSYWDDEKKENPEPEIKKEPRFGVLGIWDAKSPKEKREAVILILISQCIPPFLTIPVLGVIVLHAQYKERLKEL